MSRYVYDSGALIAIDRSRDSARSTLTERGSPAGDHIMVPAPVAAQVVRDPQAPGPVNAHPPELRHHPLRAE